MIILDLFGPSFSITIKKCSSCLNNSDWMLKLNFSLSFKPFASIMAHYSHPKKFNISFMNMAFTINLPTNIYHTKKALLKGSIDTFWILLGVLKTKVTHHYSTGLNASLLQPTTLT